MTIITFLMEKQFWKTRLSLIISLSCYETLHPANALRPLLSTCDVLSALLGRCWSIKKWSKILGRVVAHPKGPVRYISPILCIWLKRVIWHGDNIFVSLWIFGDCWSPSSLLGFLVENERAPRGRTRLLMQSDWQEEEGNRQRSQSDRRRQEPLAENAREGMSTM